MQRRCHEGYAEQQRWHLAGDQIDLGDIQWAHYLQAHRQTDQAQHWQNDFESENCPVGRSSLEPESWHALSES